MLPTCISTSSIPATACFGAIGVRTSGSYRALNDDISATAGYGMNMVDRLITIPRNTHAIGARGKQLTVIGAFNVSTLSHNLRFGISCVHTPSEFNLLMTG